jgi:hypothetical protein
MSKPTFAAHQKGLAVEVARARIEGKDLLQALVEVEVQEEAAVEVEQDSMVREARIANRTSISKIVEMTVSTNPSKIQRKVTKEHSPRRDHLLIHLVDQLLVHVRTLMQPPPAPVYLQDRRKDKPQIQRKETERRKVRLPLLLLQIARVSSGL